MSNVLFIVAEMQEAKPLIDHYGMKDEGLNSLIWWSSEDAQLIVTGPGVQNVISTLSKAVYLGILTARTDVINVGYAGAKGIDVGEVVNVKSCQSLEFPVKANIAVNNAMQLEATGYECYTSFDFVEKADGIETALFDMELAYIARFLYRRLYSIKIVSDNLSYEGFKEFNADKAWEKAIKMIEERRKS